MRKKEKRLLSSALLVGTFIKVSERGSLYLMGGVIFMITEAKVLKYRISKVLVI